MRFCKDCNNMLYPMENKEAQLLKFVCKNCEYAESTNENTEESNCVYRNEIKLNQAAIKIDPSIVTDPTYARTKHFPCPKCSHNEAVFFQNPNQNDAGMKLIFVCCNKINGSYCGKYWFNTNM